MNRRGLKLSEKTKKKMSESHKGKPSGMLGKKLSEEHKQKIAMAHLDLVASEEARLNMSLAHKGIHYSPETQFKKGVYQGNGFKKGQRPHNYKGNITSMNLKIRTSNEYRIWRNSVFQRDDYICQKCNQRGGGLNAHHIKSFCDYKDLRFDVSNGSTLCVPCHKSTRIGDQ